MKLDKQTVATVSADVQAALQQVAAKHGLEYKREKGNYSDSIFSGKFQMLVPGAMAEQSNLYASLLNYRVRFGDTVVIVGKKFTIGEITPRGKTTLIGADGKRYVANQPALLVPANGPMTEKAHAPSLPLAVVGDEKTRFSLKALSVHNRMSEETTCFAAKLCIEVDGQPPLLVAEVQNTGKGGGNDYQWVTPEWRDRTEAEAKRLRPDQKFEVLDAIVDDLMEMEEDRKSATKMLAKGFTRVVKIMSQPVSFGADKTKVDCYNRITIVGYKDEAELSDLLKKYKAAKHVVLA